MATRTPPKGSRNGVEWRTDAKGKRAYRWIINRSPAKGGKLRGEWTDSHAEATSGRAKALGEATSAATPTRPTDKTIRAVWEEWLAGAKAGTIKTRSGKTYKPATIRSYELSWSKVDPEFGAHKLADLRRADVQAFVDRMTASGVPSRTTRNALDALRAVYARAVKREWVAVNPTKDIDGIQITKEPIRVLSVAEGRVLLAALPEKERPLWAAAMYSGLRLGELRALRWSDVDLGAGIINVSRGWDQQDGEQAPKTANAVRRVPVVPDLHTVLTERQRTTGRSGSDLIFGRTAELPFTPSTIGNNAKAAWKKATPPIEPIGLHTCRHTFASMMIDAGCNAKALSVVLGHGSITITFDTYGHLMPGGEQQVGRMLGDYLARQ